MKAVGSVLLFGLAASLSAVLSFALIDQARLQTSLNASKILDVNDSAVLSLVGSRPSLSVFFPKQSFALRQTDIEAISSLSQYLMDKCGSPKIVVYGYSSIEAFRARRNKATKYIEDRNEKLALARGESVRSALVSFGYDEKAISIESEIDNSSEYIQSVAHRTPRYFQLSQRSDIVSIGPISCEAFAIRNNEI